jgi:hypothetical protein
VGDGFIRFWGSLTRGSNPRPPHYQCDALSTELIRHNKENKCFVFKVNPLLLRCVVDFDGVSDYVHGVGSDVP